MSKVQLLDDDIISKIAAGEVIERPSSVVKELLENSLDAGATQVELILKDGGKTSIEIRDNGTGIEQDDLQRIFLRHATSKIKTREDLYHINSLGFRGEALYSIGSIADVTVKSKTKEQSEGYCIHQRGGKQLDLKPTQFNEHGTHILIQELFFNTPARKKFIKSNSAEINQILNIVIPFCLLYPKVRFKLNHQGRDLIDLSPTDSRNDRIVDALKFEPGHLLNINESPTEEMNIELVLGDINIKRSRRDMQFCFVNGRPVFSKTISYHLNQIYRLLMPKDEFPFFCLLLNLPAENIDVNIHPTKREVKIKDEQSICSFLRRISENVLVKSSDLKQATVTSGQNYEPVNRAFTQTHLPEERMDTTSFDAPSSYAASDDYAYPRTQSAQQQFFVPSDDLYQEKSNSLIKKLETARYIGQFQNKYLIYESLGSMILMDQHAAAERITYEKLIRQMDQGTLEVQNLLTPVTIKLTAVEMVAWEELKDEFEKCGLSCTLFDAETIAIHTHPVLLKDTEKAVRCILAGEKVQKNDFDTLARRACRSSIMAGDYLAPEKCEFLREHLLQCLDPHTCPHGRPCLVEMSEDFLDKQFLRK